MAKRLWIGTALALVAAATLQAQRAGGAAQDEVSKAVKDGGIKVAGWQGKMDDTRENAGLTVNDARLAQQGADLHVTTGPSMTYWNPANKVSGDYTVKATFTESDYMGLNSHPHPYGIVIAGNNMGTSTQSMLYCAAYGDGRFIVRGFGPASFAMNGGRGQSNPAVNKAEAVHKPVTQEIAMSVKGDKVSCTINGTEVASYSKAELVTAGKLSSTDGVYGLRFGHNTDAVVKGLGVVK
jgi:hypothetical protein